MPGCRERACFWELRGRSVCPPRRDHFQTCPMVRFRRSVAASSNKTAAGSSNSATTRIPHGLLVGGDATALGSSAKLANSIDRSNMLHKTYAPTSIEAILSTDEARLKVRRKLRAVNKTRAKVSPQHAGEVSPAPRGAAKRLRTLERVKGLRLTAR